MNSKRKGKAGELEAAAELRRVLGVEARRGVQHAGGPDSPDVVGLPGVPGCGLLGRFAFDQFVPAKLKRPAQINAEVTSS